MRIALPCTHEGADRPDFDAGSHKTPFPRRWLECRHPDRPLGPIVCGPMGCGAGCPGYDTDAAAPAPTALAPLWQERLHLPGEDTAVNGLTLPGWPFNGSLIDDRHHREGHHLLAYRQGRDVMLVQLNDRLGLESSPRAVALPHEMAAHSREDPRFFVHRGELHLAFTGVRRHDGPEAIDGLQASVLYARLSWDYPWVAQDVTYPHYAKRQGWEKNWAFFSGGGVLYAVYAIRPEHVVLRIDGGLAYEVARTRVPHAWHGGHARGGAGPVLVGGLFYHFFHGRLGAGHEAVYNTGVYTFHATPPFAVDRMTPYPIRWADPDTRVRADVGAAVVFPAGAVYDAPNARVLVSSGVHDAWVDVAAYPLSDIQDALKEPKVQPLPPVWCIACPELPERRAAAEKEFRRAGVPVRFWDGIHGNTFGLSTSKVYTRGECPITPNHASLILNHYNLWQHLWENDVPEAVICEDDVAFDDDFGQKAAAVLAGKPADAHFIFLGHTGCCAAKVVRQVSPGLIQSTAVYGTHCYWIDRAGIRVMLDRMRELRSHVDLQMWENVLEPRLIPWYTAQPALAGQHTAEGRWVGSLGGAPWAGIPGDLRADIETADKGLAGWCDPEKARQMAGLILSVDPRVVVEIGVYGGKSLVPQALALRHLRNHGKGPGVIYGIDPWTVAAADEFWAGETQQDRKDHREWWLERSQLSVEMANVHRHVARWELWDHVRLIAAGSEAVATWFDDRPIDVLHIDGNHHAEAATRDVRNYLPRVRPGGYVWMDDVGWETVRPAVAMMDRLCRIVLDCGNWRLYRKE